MMLAVPGGGPIITIGAALLFLWWAIMGTKPDPNVLGDDPSSVAMGVRERVLWGILAVGLILYEALKLSRWMHPLQH